LEPEGLRYQGRLFLRERLEGVRLDRLRGRLWLDFGGEGLPLPLGLPGWDEALAHLGRAWREGSDREADVLSLRGPRWVGGTL
ncbi:hypothetical protein L6232_26120, partial [Shewanella sp. C31]|nr:hypothetical protein [Shewanella electrica]